VLCVPHLLEEVAAMIAYLTQDNGDERIIVPAEIAVWESNSGSYGGYIPPLWQKDGMEYYKGKCKSCGAWVLAVFESNGSVSGRNLDFTIHKCGGKK
jgi:hypothetical protein